MKYCSSIIVLLLFFNEYSIGQSFIRSSDGSIIIESQSVIPKRTVKSVDKGIMVSYDFDYYEKIPDDTYSDASFVRIDGFGLYGEQESPALPIKKDRFSVPSRNSKVIIIDSTFVDIPLEIGPVRPPMTNVANGVCSNHFTKSIKPYYGLFPKSAISLEINEYRTSYIADISVVPVQYNYQEKKVRLYSKISYLVLFENERDVMNKSTINENNDVLLANVIMNPIDTSAISREVAQQVEVPGYLILSVPQFLSAVNKFAEWKRCMGYNVKVSCQSSWTVTDVMDVIATSNADNTLKYLLIIGDYENIPGKTITDSINTTQGLKHYTYQTDYYYGCLQQNTYPIIRRGRLSVSSANEAMIVVDKIIRYEIAPVTQQSFFDTGLNCAFFQDNNIYNNGILVEPRDGIEDVRFTLTSENIRDYLVSVKGKTVNRVYSTLSAVTPQYWNNKKYGFYDNLVAIPNEIQRSYGFQWDGDSVDISQFINAGAFYVLHRDHGEQTGWWKPSFNIDNVNNLLNGEKLPVVFSMNCLTGRYNGSTCFAESFLRKENGGCVAIFAASEESFSGYNDALTIGMFDAIWPSNGYFKSFPHSYNISLSSTPAYKLGDILDIGLSHISTIYENGYNSNVLKHTKEIFHCFGDPAMEIYTDKPTVFTDVSYSLNNNVATISVPEAGKITFYDTASGSIVSYEGTCVQYPYNSNLRITISGHNKIPVIIEEGTLFLQNETITDEVSYMANIIKVGSNVTSAKPIGDVIISGGITKLKGNTVELSAGTKVEIGAQLEINSQ